MKKILDYLEKAIKIISAVLFVGIMIMIMLQVFTRYVLNSSLSWTEQAARVMFIWMILLYAGVLVRNVANLGFDLVVEKMPAGLKEGCLFFGEFMIIAFAVFWAFQGTKLCMSLAHFTLSGVNLPYNAVYSAQPVGAALIAIFGTEVLVNHLRRRRGLEAK